MRLLFLLISAAAIIALGLLYGCNEAATPAGKEVPLVISFDTTIGEDATARVLAEVTKAREQPISELRFAKGVYHFYPEKGKEFYSYISNHKDVNVRTAFPLINFQDLVIDGQGSEFIFHGRMVPFLIEESSGITLKNFSIDWAETFHSEGMVVANDLKKGTFDLKITDEYPYEIRNDQLIFVKPYYEHPLGQTILYDPKTNGIAYRTEEYTPLTSFQNTAVKNLEQYQYKYLDDERAPERTVVGKEDRLRAEQLEPGLVRIFNHGKKIPEVGLVLSAKGHQWNNRLAPAIRILHSRDFVAENVDVHHAGGMGLIAENTTNLTLRDFNVTPSRGRMVSTTADATHFVGCRGKISITDCTLQNQLDDATNIHGVYQIVQDILGDKVIGARMGHHQQQGVQIGYPGETIGFVDLGESFFSYAELTIESIEKINNRYQIITFKEELPAELKPGQLLENVDAYPEVLVKNCTINRNRARGLLLSTPKKIVVDGNYFETEMEAMLFPVESGFWYEAGSLRDLTITNNTFQDCNISGYNRGIIRFVPDDKNKNIAFTNINISNNQINHFDNLFMEISNVDQLRFTNNTITNSKTYPRLFPTNPAIRVRASTNIVFEDNEYTGPAENILETDEKNTALKFE